MKARELAQALLNLPAEQQELEVKAIEEIWAYIVDYPRLAFTDEEGCEAESGNPCIALWESIMPRQYEP